jgi:hypothetical protein
MKRVRWGIVVTLALCGLLRADRATAQNKKVDDLLAQVRREVDQQNYVEGYRHAKCLVDVLRQPAIGDEVRRASYLESYYLMTVCIYEHGKMKKIPREIESAAYLIVQLECEQHNFHGDPWVPRFRCLLQSNPDLRAAYDAQKLK